MDKTKVNEKPMRIVGKKFSSVSALVHASTDPEFADEFDRYQEERRLVNCLTTIRCSSGVSQDELANRMKCGQSKISRVESSIDSDLNFGDIVAYALALKRGVYVEFGQTQRTAANRVRFHVACIKRELDNLSSTAGNDKVIGEGIEAFGIEQIQKMVDMIEGILDRLPHRAEQAGPPVSVEAEGERGQRLSVDGPKRVRRTTPKKV